MPPEGKIEKYSLEPLIAELRQKNKKISCVDIATKCSDNLKEQGIKDKISAMAISRYFNRLPARQAAIIKQSKSRIVKTVTANYDIIQSQLKVSKKMFEQMDELEHLPELAEEYFKRIENILKDAESDEMVSLVDGYFKYVRKEFSKQLDDLATINKEVRSNNEFLTKLQEKIYEYGLIQEFIRRLLENIREEAGEEVYKAALQRIAKDPRMAKIVEQQNIYNGGNSKDEEYSYTNR
ncbi:MAG: hypothetical protein CVU87_02700 [Firmicutes bacterium HGW-Firmicutes-12]|jgi:methyl-accepting chemotaxis protein|nr:MAG: hypothetical protein CVU87_02700 [Firmicutes bacterium HGW-Firmicutes-12]